MMLHVTPKSWFSPHFSVSDGDGVRATLEVAMLREAATLTIDGEEYRLYREGWASGDFMLERNGALVACATKPSALHSMFELAYEGRRYTLRRESLLRRDFGLYEHETRIGTLRPASIWSRAAEIDLPAELPLPVRIFIAWLMLLIWQRDRNAAASSSR
jgi:hypothetical protein